MQKTIRNIEKTGRINNHKISNFFLTLNTNSAELISPSLLRKKGNEFFEHIEEFFRFLIPGQGVNFLDSIDIQTAIESGSKYGRVHLHALIKVNHRTKILMDLRKIKSYFEKELNLPSVYVNVKFVKDNSISLVNYMRKIDTDNFIS